MNKREVDVYFERKKAYNRIEIVGGILVIFGLVYLFISWHAGNISWINLIISVGHVLLGAVIIDNLEKIKKSLKDESYAPKE